MISLLFPMNLFHCVHTFICISYVTLLCCINSFTKRFRVPCSESRPFACRKWFTLHIQHICIQMTCKKKKHHNEEIGKTEKTKLCVNINKWKKIAIVSVFHFIDVERWKKREPLLEHMQLLSIASTAMKVCGVMLACHVLQEKKNATHIRQTMYTIFAVFCSTRNRKFASIRNESFIGASRKKSKQTNK